MSSVYPQNVESQRKTMEIDDSLQNLWDIPHFQTEPIWDYMSNGFYLVSVNEK